MQYSRNTSVGGNNKRNTTALDEGYTSRGSINMVEMMAAHNEAQSTREVQNNVFDIKDSGKPDVLDVFKIDESVDLDKLDKEL